MKPTIGLSNGKEFDYTRPWVCEYGIDEIATALARCGRFAGNADRSVYVSDHSIAVWTLVCAQTSDPIIRLGAILHDASEFVTGDIPGPMKQLVPDLKPLELVIQISILKKLFEKYIGENWTEIDYHDIVGSKTIKLADTVALEFERMMFCPKNDWWPVTEAAKKIHARFPHLHSIYVKPDVSEHVAFLSRRTAFKMCILEAFAYFHKCMAEKDKPE